MDAKYLYGLIGIVIAVIGVGVYGQITGYAVSHDASQIFSGSTPLIGADGKINSTLLPSGGGGGSAGAQYFKTTSNVGSKVLEIKSAPSSTKGVQESKTYTLTNPVYTATLSGESQGAGRFCTVSFKYDGKNIAAIGFTGYNYYSSLSAKLLNLDGTLSSSYVSDSVTREAYTWTPYTFSFSAPSYSGAPSPYLTISGASALAAGMHYRNGAYYAAGATGLCQQFAIGNYETGLQVLPVGTVATMTVNRTLANAGVGYVDCYLDVKYAEGPLAKPAWAIPLGL